MISTANAFAALQGLLGARVLARMVATSRGVPISIAPLPADARSVAAIVPVLNESSRLANCLDGLIAQPNVLCSIVVVDGGSTDGTQEVIRRYAARDARIRLVDAAPVPDDWNGKAWNLACGLAATDPDAYWIVTIDADVRARHHLIASLLAHAAGIDTPLDAFSAAPLLELSGAAEAVVHPAFLATLVYRFGLPGNVAKRPSMVQANGQCFVARRALLLGSAAFAAARRSRCDDVTIARHLVRLGARVGFYEGALLSTVRMYESAGDCWRNWPRSLALRDRETSRMQLAAGLAEIAFVQALPLAIVLSLLVLRRQIDSPLFRINIALVLARLGVLAGTRRAYADAGPAYWLAIFSDAPVVVRLIQATFATTHVWRGRTLVAEGSAT